MVSEYDLTPYRPWNYYSKPRYYTTYVPTCLVSDRYHNAYRFYRPMNVSSSHEKARAYLPYIPSSDYHYSNSSAIDTTTPLSAMLSPFNPESVRFDYTYGTDFASTTQDIRESANKLLQDVQTPSTRKTRAVSLEPYYTSDLDCNATRRITSRGRLISAEPLTRRITTVRYN
ncbi:uncharacterized protein LOC119067644 [Bradysia coprophila]|uniref:uncharacterized protein LOC119067644 n=1 Tax=Bradysia coprophila TaxID=38358 RepID=UPI00187DC144|nr:uncharacterized protein LOC119067644 [Bradysia coprophila]